MSPEIAYTHGNFVRLSGDWFERTATGLEMVHYSHDLEIEFQSRERIKPEFQKMKLLEFCGNLAIFEVCR